MRKIIELEAKIELLERDVAMLEKTLEHRYTILDTEIKGVHKRTYEFTEKVNKLEKILQEQEKNLTEVAYPFILHNELKVFADLFTEEPKKSVGKKTNKAKKESK